MKMYVTNKYKIVKPKKEPFVILVSKDFNKKMEFVSKLFKTVSLKMVMNVMNAILALLLIRKFVYPYYRIVKLKKGSNVNHVNKDLNWIIINVKWILKIAWNRMKTFAKNVKINLLLIKIFVSHKFKIVKLKNQFNAKSAYKAFY